MAKNLEIKSEYFRPRVIDDSEEVSHAVSVMAEKWNINESIVQSFVLFLVSY